MLQTSLRSWWAPVAGACLGAAAGLILWQDLPKTYEARATLLAAPPSIPQEIAGRGTFSSPSENVAVHLAALRESILSRSFLERLHERLRAEHGRAPLPADIGPNLDAQVIRFDDRRGSGVFELQYEDRDPQRAAQVLNAIVDQYIEESGARRSSRAQGAAEVFERLAGDLRRQLEAREAQIAAFKSQHVHELPETRDGTVRLLEARQRDLEAIEREISDTQEQRDVYAAQSELARSLPGLVAGGTDVPGGRETRVQRVGRLQSELANLRLRYTDSHPAVRMKREELQRAIEAPREDEELAGADTGTGSGEVIDEFTPRIQAADREIERLRAAREAMRGQIASYEARLTRTPNVDQKLAELTKDYDVLLEKYRDYQLKAQNARGTHTAEDLRSGEAFDVIERAAPPRRPVSPLPALMAGIGVLAGLVLFGGPVLARAALAPPVVSREGLRLISPVPVLATIGELHTPRARRAKFRRSLWSWSAVAVSVAVLALTAARFMTIG